MREKFAKVILQDNSLSEKYCYILPYAGFDVEKTFEREKRCLIEFGFSPDKIKFVKNRLDIASKAPDFIYVPGGNPFKLLQSIKEINLVNEIIDCVKNGSATYIGVSAGADIATKDIAYVLQLEDNNKIRFSNYFLIACWHIGDSIFAEAGSFQSISSFLHFILPTEVP